VDIVRLGPIDGAAKLQTQVGKMALRDRVLQKLFNDD